MAAPPRLSQGRRKGAPWADWGPDLWVGLGYGFFNSSVEDGGLRHPLLFLLFAGFSLGIFP
jgi:hypothetical protein